MPIPSYFHEQQARKSSNPRLTFIFSKISNGHPFLAVKLDVPMMPNGAFLSISKHLEDTKRVFFFKYWCPLNVLVATLVVFSYFVEIGVSSVFPFFVVNFTNDSSYRNIHETHECGVLQMFPL